MCHYINFSMYVSLHQSQYVCVITSVLVCMCHYISFSMYVSLHQFLVCMCHYISFSMYVSLHHSLYVCVITLVSVCMCHYISLSIYVSLHQSHNCIGCVMVSMLASSAVDRGFEPRLGKTKDYKIGICCFSAKHAGERAKTVWFGIRIMCPSGVTCLPADCCFSELAL